MKGSQDLSQKEKLFSLLLALFLLGLLVQKKNILSAGPGLEQLADSLKAGLPMGEAVETFCREMLHHGF